MYIIIVGGGNVGYYLTKTLVSAGHEALLLEKDRVRYRTISEELGEVVMQGDGCQADQQMEAGFACLFPSISFEFTNVVVGK